MKQLENIGARWGEDQADLIPDKITHVTPVDFCEQYRYLPRSVGLLSGYIRFDVNPFMREIVNCFDVNSPVREVNLMKGVQITYTTALESGLFYYIGHVKTSPVMYMTADKELAAARVENNFIPMLNQSDMGHLIRSSDELSTRKTGKALCIDTLIPTPKGDSRMGDLSVGDSVFSLDGTATKIINESPIHERYSYEIRFANGEKIIASDDHRWIICPRGNQLKDRILTTKDMFDAGVKCGKDYRYRVRVPAPIKLCKKELKIEPYTLGAWLGDGNSNGARITAGDDAAQILSEIKKDGYFIKKSVNLKRCDTYAIRVHVDCRYNIGHGFKAKLDSYALIKNKHIPDVYFRSSVKQRTRLLQGLMDTDGSASKKGECEITQKNKVLAHDVWRLVSSLGIKTTVKHRITKSQNGTSSNVYRIKFYAVKNDAPFTLSRKLSRLKDSLHSRSKKNTILEIKPVGMRAVKCIGVDHLSKLFLCGKGYVPTHNTINHLQWAGGGYMVPFGAKNADKMRSFSIQILLKDEIDAWPDIVGKDGDPDKLSDDRCSGYWERRKIFRGSTPLVRATSKIYKAYKDGDRRKYMVLCKKCSFPQSLMWETVNKETGIVGGFKWDTSAGVLDIESVRYCCQNCGEPHMEHDKELLFATENGAKWEPTATPKQPYIRSYHLPATYSPIGMQPWYKSVASYLDGWDPVTRKVIDIGKYQVFYNNVLARPFRIEGSKVQFVQASAHRRAIYRLGSIPNKYALEYSGSEILFLIMCVDVHKTFLAVSVFGCCKHIRLYLIDYWRLEGDDCTQGTSPVWNQLRGLIEEKEYIADDGKQYRIIQTFIDAGYCNELVTTFCSEYMNGVFPILGRDRPSKNQRIEEFAKFTTQAGYEGYRILVDHYKDRLSSVLRADWIEDMGEQPRFHFNAPVDISDKQLKELTVESRQKKTDDKGVVTYYWHRPGNAPNELWDLLGYAHACVEVIAWNICIQHFELETIDWDQFWTYIEEEKLYYSE